MAEETNDGLLEKLTADSPGDFVAASQSMIENYAEPEVLGYVTRALMEDEEGKSDNPSMSEETLEWHS